MQRDAANTATKDEIVNRIGRKAWIHVAELTDRKAVKAIVPTLAEQGLKPNILVTCAGIQRRHPSHQFPDEDWDEVSGPNHPYGLFPQDMLIPDTIGPRSEPLVSLCALP